MSIWKLGPFIGVPSSNNTGSPKLTSIKIGSEISSTTLKLDFNEISKGKGSKVFNNNSCLTGSLFNKILIQGTNTSFPKFIENSLKYEVDSISEINPFSNFKE